MKNILVMSATLAVALMATNKLYAQSETTALSLAEQHDARGSARYQALSGAMGAVGADFSAIHQNPAGLSYFRSGGRVSLSLAHSTYGGRDSWGGRSMTLEDRSRLHFDALSFVGNYTTSNGVNIAYGIGLQNNGRIQRTTNASRANPRASLANYAKAALNNNDPFVAPSSINAPFEQLPWLQALTYDTPVAPYNEIAGLYENGYGAMPENATLQWTERGAMSNLDFALAAELSPSFSIGGSLSFATLDYEYSSFYRENYQGQDRYAPYHLQLSSRQSISGVGVRLGLGALFRIGESLRLGGGIYTPILYGNMKFDSFADLTAHSKYSTDNNKAQYRAYTPTDGGSEFGLTTPWRFTLSGAYVFGHRAILSADYEYQNYAGTRLRNASNDDYYSSSDNVYSADNDALKDDLGGAHTLRLGLEYNLSSRLALRLGYKHVSSPEYTKDLTYDEPAVRILTAGASVHYRLPGAVNNYSLGLGYKLSPKWTLDVAYAYRSQDARVGAFPFIRDYLSTSAAEPQGTSYRVEMIKEKQTQSNITATISYRF